MKTWISLLLVVAASGNALGDGMKAVRIDGVNYTNISDVHIGANGRVIIFTSDGGTSAGADKLPLDFLKSWGIDPSTAKATETTKTAQALENAIASGSFRKVDGVVYDIRKSESGWVTFPRANVIQVLGDGAILNITPNAENWFTVHVRHLGDRIGDTDAVTFTAKLTGNYSYINKLNDDRTIRDYDCGQVCSRNEIPASVLSGRKALDVADSSESTHKDQLASLPESGDLKASGTGFFITEDGFLISNNHVVKNAVKVRVLTSTGTIDAKVVQTDSANDLALLKVDGKFSCLPIVTSRAAHLGETVMTIGFPDVVLQGFSPKLSKGEVASLSGIQDDPRFFQISVPVQPGNSGGALVDEQGNVVGVVSAKLDGSAALLATGALPENVNYAVKSSLILSFLESIPAISSKLKAPFTSDKKTGEIVQAAQDASVLVLVY